VCEQLSLKPRAVFGLVRVAVTGTSISPGLFESICALGRDETLTRLGTAAARL
jgi:glutamyl-tRNA synthetase